LQPHRKRYWLTPPSDDSTQLAEQICTVCEIYEATPALAAQDTHMMSSDEMTSIQALERLHQSLPMLPAHIAQTIQADPEATWIFITDQREHPSIGDLGTPDGCAVWHPGGPGHQRQKRATSPAWARVLLFSPTPPIAFGSSTLPNTVLGSTKLRSGGVTWCAAC
jgi:hypothetical protein